MVLGPGTVETPGVSVVDLAGEGHGTHRYPSIVGPGTLGTPRYLDAVLSVLLGTLSYSIQDLAV